MDRTVVALLCTVALSPACTRNWKSQLTANSRQVAQALHDPVEFGPDETFDPRTLPQIDAPDALRPCCAFGLDLKAKVGPVPVPLYELENILSLSDIGPHGYDKSGAKLESNGLLYTCRGGFIDLAHVRDNIDRTLYLAIQIVRALPGELTLELPFEGSARRMFLRPLPKGMMERHGRWPVAIALASWANYKLSLWHEIVTWYGWESTKGVSERLSAFSPEDAYSNALGTNLAAGILTNREARSRDQYDESAAAWIRESLRRLAVVPKEAARAAMKTVDHHWWDSDKRLPDWKLVTRRSLDVNSPVGPWLVEDAFGGATGRPQVCSEAPPRLPLIIPDKVGDTDIAELVTIEFEFSKWVPEHFPLPAAEGRKVTQADFEAILAAVRSEGERDLGPEFDKARSEGKADAKADAKAKAEADAKPEVKTEAKPAG